MLVEVTVGDLSVGVPGRCMACATAVAIQRTLRQFDVRVELGHVWVGRPALAMGRWIKLPDFAWENVLRFDRGEHIKPYSFDLDISNA